MIVASYIVAVLAILSGAVTGAFGLLVWAKTLDERQQDDLRTSLIGYVAGLVFTLLGFAFIVAGAEIWP